MSYHSLPHTNKEARKLLGPLADRFMMGRIIGKPARTKGKIVIKGNKVTIFGNSFVCHGYLKDK